MKIRNSQFVIRNSLAFTLIELLTVLAILGILAALVVPALKNFGHSNATVSASRQLLDDVARARQLAISQRKTVYMVFVPANFWTIAGPFPNAWWTGLLPAQKTTATNLCDKQLTGYTFMTYGAMGDQPGQHNWHYLAPWQNLPDNTFIATNKFIPPTSPPFQIANYRIYGFDTNAVPFPTEDSSLPFVPMPCIAFNYLGQLTFDGQNPAGRDEYIPLARGSVFPAINPATRAFILPGSPDVSEIPPGNSASAYNIIDIDPLTGRATLQQPKMGP
jgi:prepilin-type N-terminal cleavage/methylation domain-containing protein